MIAEIAREVLTSLVSALIGAAQRWAKVRGTGTSTGLLVLQIGGDVYWPAPTRYSILNSN
ncbi:MAG: hypothetical protein HOV79_11060 [Hamadaea sp.]|nr:hypothetical protein [Hamadaea sp.]